MGVTKQSSGVIGALAKDGRLTRGGMLAVLHWRENYAAAPWTSVAGVGLLIVTRYWRPRARTDHALAARGAQ